MKIGVILYFASFFGMLSPAFGVNPLLSIQTTSPLCTSTMDLGVGRDYFVAIGNDLPGLQEYNQLVKLYQTRRYKEFSEEIKRFYKIFESSPLKEAAYFLEAQELFEEYLLKRTEEPLEAEKKMREALLLYPKSEMVPVLLAGAGNFWLQRGVFEKSLGIYQSARDQFPFHPLYCVFQMGIGESAWQLGDRKAAKSSFTLLQQKCENSRLKLASEFRLMELENPEFNQITPNDKRESKMEALYQKGESIFDRYLPQIAYELGERKYQRQEWLKAKHYFTLYLGQDVKKLDNNCAALADKRLVDIAFQRSESKDKIVGGYLSVQQKYPDTDPGLYSHIFALLLELKRNETKEYERKIRVIDDEIDKIKDKSMRSAAYLAKGVALLSEEHEKAIDYLIHFSEKAELGKEQSKVIPYVQEKISDFLKVKNPGDLSSEFRESLIKAYPLWAKGTRKEGDIKRLYRDWIGRQLEDVLAHQKQKEAFELLKSASEINFDSKDKEWLSKTSIFSLMRLLAKSSERKITAESIQKNYEAWKEYISPSQAWFYDLIAFEMGDKPKRKISSVLPEPIALPPDLKPYYFLVRARAAVAEGNGKEVISYSEKIKELPWQEEAVNLSSKWYEQKKDWSNAFRVTSGLLPKLKEEKASELLRKMESWVEKGKLWKQGTQLLTEAEKKGLKGEELGSYYYLAGKSYAENSDCKNAIEKWNLAFKTKPEDKSLPEAKYRMGKCYLKIGKKLQARQVWEDLVKIKDSFWSPLAQNEIRIQFPQ